MPTAFAPLVPSPLSSRRASRASVAFVFWSLCSGFADDCLLKPANPHRLASVLVAQSLSLLDLLVAVATLSQTRLSVFQNIKMKPVKIRSLPASSYSLPVTRYPLLLPWLLPPSARLIRLAHPSCFLLKSISLRSVVSPCGLPSANSPAQPSAPVVSVSAFAARAHRRLLTTAYRRQSFSTIDYLRSLLSPLPLRLAGHTQNIRGHKQITKT